MSINVYITKDLQAVVTGNMYMTYIRSNIEDEMYQLYPIRSRWWVEPCVQKLDL